MVSAQSNNVPEQLANKKWYVNYLVINGAAYNKPQTSQEQTLFSSVSSPWFSERVTIDGQTIERPDLSLSNFALMELNLRQSTSSNFFSLSTRLYFENDCFFRLLDNDSGSVITSDTFTFSSHAEFSYPEDNCIINADFRAFQQAHIAFFDNYIQQPFGYQIENDDTTGEKLIFTNSNDDSIEFNRVSPSHEFDPPEILLKSWTIDRLIVHDTVYRLPEVQHEHYDFEGTFYDDPLFAGGLYLEHCYSTSFSALFEKESDAFHIIDVGGTLGSVCPRDSVPFDNLLSAFFNFTNNNPYRFTLQYSDPSSENIPLGVVITNSDNDSLFMVDETLRHKPFESPILLSFPNPVQNQLFIKITNGEIHQVVIYDLYGRKVLESSERKIDVLGLTKGLYLVKISSTHGVVTKKMIKS
ncbi:MAG: T9SS type A sorting domain-containing protein [Flavobacteriaceae bacterium]|nr:T9SS type A sorting domain-containing protein [Flavobacteriaceae bacterium]